MRRKPYTTYIEHDATAFAPAAVSWGPAGFPQNPPPPAGPDFLVPPPLSEEDLALILRQTQIEQNAALIMPWFECAAGLLVGLTLLLLAQPIAEAIRASF